MLVYFSPPAQQASPGLGGKQAALLLLTGTRLRHPLCLWSWHFPRLAQALAKLGKQSSQGAEASPLLRVSCGRLRGATGVETPAGAWRHQHQEVRLDTRGSTEPKGAPSQLAVFEHRSSLHPKATEGTELPQR